MRNNKTIRNIIPHNIPKKLWISKDYNIIILYALEIYGPMYQQEFVNRSNITDKISEKTFYNHIKKLKQKRYIESEIDEKTRRNKYIITTNGEEALKKNLRINQERYGELLSTIEDLKYFEKKRVFEEDFDIYLNLCKRIKNKFLAIIVDITHFYSREKISQYAELKQRLNTELRLKKALMREFDKFTIKFTDYKRTIEDDLLKSESEIFINEEIETYDFQCPRCNENIIIDYEETFECLKCNLEFDKVSFKLIEKDNILSIEEKRAFLDIFKDNIDDDNFNNH